MYWVWNDIGINICYEKLLIKFEEIIYKIKGLWSILLNRFLIFLFDIFLVI